MSEVEKQEGQKTVVAFVAGLLIGGLLVWVFSSAPQTEAPAETGDEANVEAQVTDSQNEVPDVEVTTEEETLPEASTLEIGDGAIEVADQAAGNSVSLDRATFPVAEGWIAVRSYPNGQLGSILGAARFSEAQNLVPEEVPLLAPTTAGRTYAVVFFSEDGNREFNLSGDSQIDGILTTFTAQ